MSHPLADHLDALRRRLRRAGALRGAMLVVVAGVVGLVVAGVLDGLLRSDVVAARLMLTAIAVAPATFAAVAIFLPAVRARLSDIELARRVESQDPSWGGRLSAAAEFLRANPVAGSTELQRHLVETTTDRVSSRPLPDLVDPVRLRRPIVAAMALCAAVALLVAIAPSASTTAAARIAFPLAAIEWPRAVDLVLLAESGDPLGPKIQVGRGQSFRFTVLNRRGDVPEDLTLEVVPPAGGRRSEPVPIAEEPSPDGPVRNVGVATLFASEGPLRFRVVGGDHRDMPFVTAEVVPPPVFDRFQVTVTPPAYLALEPTTLASGVGALTGIVGSSVTVEARANTPLAAAELRLGDRPGPPTELGDDGRTVVATFGLSEPGLSSYWFRLRDLGGFESPIAPRYEIRGVADAPPEVSIVNPPDDVRATADAELPILVEAADDHALTAVRIRFGRELQVPSDSEGAADAGRTIPLFEGPDRPLKGSYPLFWSLQPLGLALGDQIAFRGEASDAFDLGPPRVGSSSPRTITIVSAVEKREEILERQTELLGDLTEARRDAARLRQGVEELHVRLDRTGELRSEDHDLLARAEYEQRRLASKLIDPADGVERRAARAQIELHSNHIDDPALADRLGRVGRELAALREDALPAADRNLTAARKAPDSSGVSSALTAAEGDLASVIDGLDALLEELGAWRSRRELAGEVGDVLATQRELTEETASSAAQTLGTASGQLTGEQIGDLERLGLRQSELAERLARLAAAVERLAEGDPAEDATASDPGDAGVDEPPTGDSRLRDAAERLREAALPAAARAAGESIRTNDLGEAGRLQRQLLGGLRDLSDALARTDSAVPDADALHTEARRLDQLVADQQEVLETLRKAADSPDGLADESRETLRREQARLREDAASAARRLRDADAGSAASAAADAARNMSEGLERLTRRDDPDAARSLEQAIEDLRRAEREANREADRRDDRLARELAESSAGLIAALAERQGSINDEVARLDALKSERGRLSRSQLLTLRRTTESQTAVAAETATLAQKLDAAAAVALTLRSAAGRMQLLEEALREQATDEAARGHGIAAKDQLDRVASALAPQDPAGAADGSPSEGSDESGPPGEMISLLAQLTLVKALQEDLLQRTVDLDEARSSREPSDAEQGALERLGEEQAELAELFLRLVGGSPAAAGEASP